MTVERRAFGEVFSLERREPELSAGEAVAEIGIRSFGRGVFHKSATTLAGLRNKRVYRIREGDLLISNVFAWEGAIAIAGSREDGLIGSHRFMTWTPQRENVLVPYVRDYLLTTGGLDAIGKSSPGSAGRNRTLSVEALKRIEIPLPEFDRQREVAARLASVSELAGKLLKETTKREAVDGVAPKVVTEVLNSLTLPRIRVGDLFDSIHDLVRPGDDPGDARRFVGLEHIASHVGSQSDQSGIQDLKGRKLRFEKGDVLYGSLRPYLNKVWVANGPGLCSVEQYVLRPRAGVDSRLLGHILRRQGTLDAVNAATHNLQLPRIRSGLLAEIKVPDIRLAPADLANRLDSINGRARDATRLVTRSQGLISSILPAARNEEFRKLLGA